MGGLPHVPSREKCYGTTTSPSGVASSNLGLGSGLRISEISAWEALQFPSAMADVWLHGTGPLPFRLELEGGSCRRFTPLTPFRFVSFRRIPCLKPRLAAILLLVVRVFDSRRVGGNPAKTGTRLPSGIRVRVERETVLNVRRA